MTLPSDVFGGSGDVEFELPPSLHPGVEATFAMNGDRPGPGDRRQREVPNAPSDGEDARGVLPDPALVELVDAELGITGIEAAQVAAEVGGRVRSLHIARLAKRVVDDEVATADQYLGAARSVNAAEFVTEESEPAAPLFGELAAEGHNVTLTAAFKVGKTTVVENAGIDLATGGHFLGRFRVDGPRRVALLNYELTEADMRDRMRAWPIPPEALALIHVVNLRGTHLCLTAPAGRAWLLAELAPHRPDVLIVDTYGAAAGPSIESENDNAGARRFLTTVDSIKAELGCPSSIMSAHTGRQMFAEGTEHARGATVLDDWADVRLVLTRDVTTGARYLASEGRGEFQLLESVLSFDAATRRLLLPDVGMSRAETRKTTNAQAVPDVVGKVPGIDTTDLREALGDVIPRTDDRSAAISKAGREGLVHTHKKGRKQCHYLGSPHPDDVPCPAQQGGTEQHEIV